MSPTSSSPRDRARRPDRAPAAAATTPATGHWGLAILLLAGLVLLLLHARIYAFLTDDAYISFRYARNFAEGHGLVFNPGVAERVEGYSNLLWVLVLALLDRLGVAPERAANPLSVLCTVALWAVVARYAWRRRDVPGAMWLGLAVVGLAITRSVAVWTTSGLETRCFELWVVAGCLRLADEIEATLEGGAPRPWAAVLFGLGALTRPDGLLLGAAALAAGAALVTIRRLNALPRVLAGCGVFAAIVGGMLAFRRIYYGDWVPNTYYAKVGGHTDVALGLEYLQAFALEYAAWVWLPLAVYGAVRLARSRAWALPVVTLAALAPYTAYVAVIGGDHFEYRPLDLVFPLLFVLAAEGVRGIAASRAGRAGALAACVAAGAGLAVRPWQTHAQFPPDYHPGFPGHPGYETGVARDFLEPGRDGLYRLPLLDRLAARHRALLFALTRRFACIRQEEHWLFLGTSLAEGGRIKRLMDDGRLPRDVYLALSCVGAMPYVSNARTLDRHGLTDAHVARSPLAKDPLLAHGKFATIEYARERGVDLWTVDKAYLFGEVTSESVLQSIRYAARDHEDDWAADTGDGWMILAQLPGGPERARRRMPRLVFQRLDDPAFITHFVDVSLPRYLEYMEKNPRDIPAAVRLAYVARMGGRWDVATRAYEALIPLLPPTPDLYEQLADCYEGLGAWAQAAGAVERAIELARTAGDAERVARDEARLNDDRGRAGR